MQSGGLGFAPADRLSRLGIGISSFASIGDKLDVSSNDMLMWWQQDGKTKLAVLYIESFGNPRKFARTARQVAGPSRCSPWRPGVQRPGSRPPRRTRRRSPRRWVTREALFRRPASSRARLRRPARSRGAAGHPARPGGYHVAIVSNVGGAGVLTADSCTDSACVHRPHRLTRRRLHALVPPAARPPARWTPPPPSPRAVPGCLEIVAADRGVGAVTSWSCRPARPATWSRPSAPTSASRSRPSCSIRPRR